jgi:hypothetical protein
MSEENQHLECVEAWIARRTDEAANACVDAFQAALTRLWRRACLTLGEVTLGAIVDRVLINTAQRFPAFAVMRLGPDGVHCGELREARIERAVLIDGMRFALLELLTVIGNLTAEILTPALHAELAEGGAPEASS